MTTDPRTSDLAYRLGEQLRTAAPWEIIAERSTRFELHLQGSTVELERGPITVEGYGVRLIRSRGSGVGTGFQASTDLSPHGLEAAVRAAEVASRHAEFPAKSVDLPTGSGRPADVPIVDPKLWSEPAGTLREYVDALLAAFSGRSGTVPSFGSVKGVLSEVSLANSSGLRVAYPSTRVDLEVAVKAFGGPEGAPPGEYWVTDSSRRLEPERCAGQVEAWCRYAADVRRAKAPPSGDLAVLLPTDVLTGIVLPVVGFRLTGAAQLRKVAPEVGTVIAADSVTVKDEGDYPWSIGSAPYDDEGAAHSARTLLDRGKATGLLYDSLYGAAFATRSTASGMRRQVGPTGALRFAHAPGPGPSTLVIGEGDGGSVEELAEQAGEGVLVTQLGWARPDAISGAFGGEIRIGYRIRNGKLAEPVRGGTVGGVVLAPPGGHSLLADVQGVGSKAEMSEGLVSPPLLIRPLTVAGA